MSSSSIVKVIQGRLNPSEEQRPNEMDSAYKYWRVRIMYTTYIGYAAYYFTRKNFVFALPAMVKSLHLDKSQIGLLGTLFYVTYGVSKFVSGILSDKSNPRYFMSVGLILTGVSNIAFGLCNTIPFFMLFWVLNGFFQGWGWPPCARSLCNWYSQKERGRWWAVWNTSHNVGGGLIPIIAAYCAQGWGWRYAMYVPGIIAILVGLFLMNRLRDSPKSLGLPSIEDYRNDHPDAEVGTEKYEKEALSKKQILIKYVLKNKYIWALGISYACVYFVRTAINDWGTLYLTERGYSVVAASSCVSFFEVGGFFGSLVAGWGSDLVFRGKRGPMNVLFSFFSIFAILGLYGAVGHIYVIHSLLFFLIGFFIFGPQMLIGMAAAELSHKEAAGASTGFVSLFAYLGAALSAYPVGSVTQHYGWVGFFVMMVVSLIAATVFLIPLWSAKTYAQMEKRTSRK